MKRKFALVLTAAMLASTAGFAAEMDSVTNNVVVRGTAEGAQNVTILIKDSEGNPAYIREAEIVNGEYFTKFKFPDYKDGEYTISVWSGGEDVTSDTLTAEVQSTRFESKVELTGSNANKYFNEGDTIRLNTEIKNLFADEDTYKIYVACYNADGTLIGAVSGDEISLGYGYDGEAQTGEFSGVTVPEGTSFVKVMAWSENIRPIAKVKEQATGDKMFQDGDGVAIVGDSLTHMGAYNMFIEHFYQTRYPDREIDFYKKGVSGQQSQHVLNRLESDVWAEGANRMTLLIGHNDVAESTNHEAAAANAINNISSIIDKAKEKGIEITLLTPPASDDRESYNGYWGEAVAREGYFPTSSANHNAAKAILAEAIIALAEEKGVSCYDLYAISTEINAKAEAAGDTGYVLTCNDRLHASPAGDIVFAYALIKGQGASPTVATVDLSAAGVVALTDNCEVSGIDTSNGISYTYTPYSSPIGEVETLGESTNPNSGMGYADVQEYLDITSELNQEIIRVTGLEEGEYTLTLNGTAVSTAYTADELAEGVNIALLTENPNQERAKQAWELIKKKNSTENKLRNIQSTIWYGGDKAYALGEAAWKEWLAAKEGHVHYSYFKNYPENLANKKQIEAEARAYSDEAAELSKPISYTVTVTKN